LFRGIIKPLADFVGQLDYGDKIANTATKAHRDCKISAINMVYERKEKVEGGCCINKLGPASQGSFEVDWANRAQPPQHVRVACKIPNLISRTTSMRGFNQLLAYNGQRKVRREWDP